MILLMTLNFGALTFLSRLVESLDYLKPETLMELSLSKLNTILDNQDIDMEKEYERIRNSRRTISKNDFRLYVRLLENNHNISNAKEMFKYVSQIYNDNAIIQDNISIKDYLKEMATIKSKKLFSMRLFDITQRLSINDINFDNFNEEKMLLNDVESKY